VGQHEPDTEPREGKTTAEARRIKDLEREVKELRRANEILKLGAYRSVSTSSVTSASSRRRRLFSASALNASVY